MIQRIHLDFIVDDSLVEVPHLKANTVALDSRIELITEKYTVSLCSFMNNVTIHNLSTESCDTPDCEIYYLESQFQARERRQGYKNELFELRNIPH